MMSTWICGAVAVFGIFGVALAQDAKTKTAAAPAAGVTPEVRKNASYGIGVTVAKNFKAQGINVDLDAMVQGLKDGLAGTSKLTDQQIQQALQAFNQEVEAKQAEMAKSAADKNLADGQAYLASNKTKEGVKVTKTGLQYKILKDGTGPAPKATDSVKVHYEGRLINGEVFDSSIQRGEPAVFPVSQVIPGWTEALQLMKVGSKWQIVIPSELAYGSEMRPGSPIGPNSVLIFDVELLGIEKE
jgi:FKBP-type peptidyl-prolyl cis-trans isomerase FklB